MMSVKPRRQSLTTTGLTWTGCLSPCAMRRREGTARQAVVAGEGGEVVGGGGVEGGEVVGGGAVEGGEVVGAGAVGGEEGAGVEAGEDQGGAGEAEGGEEVRVEVRVDVKCLYIFLVHPCN